MYDRFTHSSRTWRGSIPKGLRQNIYQRDDYTCQFCGRTLAAEELTIDHLVPLALGGLDEKTNYVTACFPCNHTKGSMPLADYAQSINIDIEQLPVHGDPIIDNANLPIQIRLIRKRVFNKSRKDEIRLTGRQAQKKLEKAYRTDYWRTTEGQALESELPLLPGHARIMVPEIQAIAVSLGDYILLIELAKSANTRNLIGSVLTRGCDVQSRLESIERSGRDAALIKRIAQARQRAKRELRLRRSDGTLGPAAAGGL
jgi:HNH endonuclease